MNNSVAIVDNLGTSLTEASVRALFSDINPSPFHVDTDQATVIIEVDSTAVGEDATIWYAAQEGYVNDFSDATIDVVGSVVDGGDLAWAGGNFA